jgi:hypothetical protein
MAQRFAAARVRSWFPARAAAVMRLLVQPDWHEPSLCKNAFCDAGTCGEFVGGCSKRVLLCLMSNGLASCSFSAGRKWVRYNVRAVLLCHSVTATYIVHQ